MIWPFKRKEPSRNKALDMNIEAIELLADAMRELVHGSVEQAELKRKAAEALMIAARNLRP